RWPDSAKYSRNSDRMREVFMSTGRVLGEATGARSVAVLEDRLDLLGAEAPAVEEAGALDPFLVGAGRGVSVLLHELPAMLLGPVNVDLVHHLVDQFAVDAGLVEGVAD